MVCFRPIAVVLPLCFAFSAFGGDLPRVNPEEVGLSATVMAGLKPALQNLVDERKIPGGIAMTVRHGKVADITTFGYRDLEAQAPMTDDTIFAIVSMTKPITCAAVMTLVEQGKIGLDDPVYKYIPQWKDLRVLDDAQDDSKTELSTVPSKRPVTIRHLLTHTSGISYGVFADVRLKEAHQRAGVVGPPHETVADLVAQLAKVPLAHQPGEGWTYGFSHDVLGHLIEIASGQRFDRYLEKRILTPLDMRDTSFLVPEEKRGRVATIYEAGEGDILSPWPKKYGSATYFGGGDGLFSTARDYARFVQMIVNGGQLEGDRILKPGTVAAMTTNQIGEYSSADSASGDRKYGLGFGLALAPNPNGGEPVLERYYGGGVSSTSFKVIPRRDLVLLLMMQVYPTNHGGADRMFYRIVNAALEN
jgi:CubicO group peptidase (beta-lactamase class C family)